MSAVATGVVVGAWGAQQQADAARSAAAGQERAGNLSLAEMKRQFDIEQNNLAPWLRGGKKALSEMLTLMGIEGDTEAANRALLESPNYRFALEQGNRGLAGSTASAGGMGSGKAMTAATEFGKNMALGTRSNRLSELAGIAGIGKSTAETLGSSGRDYSRGMGDIWQNMANAQGAAGIQGANAWQSGILGGLGAGMNMRDYLNRQNTGNNWATNNNPNYNGPGFAWPYD